MNIKYRPLSFIIIFIIYLIAFTAGYLCYGFFSGTPLLRLFIADAAATVVVFIFSVVFNNASVYDPYWSVAPMAVIPFLMVIRGDTLALLDVLLLAAIFVWGLRLTLNWASGFKGLLHQDWRYTMYQKNNPKLWPLINFFGIQMMPTVLVFGGMIPACFMIQYPKTPNLQTYIGFIICIFCAFLQLVSDNQMARFRKNNVLKNACIDQGLWKISRHPNYLGEILFWWGIFIMQLSVLPDVWYTFIGPAAITLLFVFISIPMMEKHILLKSEAYAEYQKRVSMLIPLPKKP